MLSSRRRSSRGHPRDCEILAKVRLKLCWTQTWTAPAPVAADLAAAATLPELQQHCCCRQLFTNTTTTTIFLAVLSFQHQQRPHFTLGTCDYFPAATATTLAFIKAAVSAGNIQCAARRQKYFTSKKWFARDAIWMMTVYYCAANCTHNCCRTLCRMQHGPISPRDIAFLLCKLRNCGAGQSAVPSAVWWWCWEVRKLQNICSSKLSPLHQSPVWTPPTFIFITSISSWRKRKQTVIAFHLLEVRLGRFWWSEQFVIGWHELL